MFMLEEYTFQFGIAAHQNTVEQRELHLLSLKAICVWSVVSAIYDVQARIMVV